MMTTCRLLREKGGRGNAHAQRAVSSKCEQTTFNTALFFLPAPSPKIKTVSQITENTHDKKPGACTHFSTLIMSSPGLGCERVRQKPRILLQLSGSSRQVRSPCRLFTISFMSSPTTSRKKVTFPGEKPRNICLCCATAQKRHSASSSCQQRKK